jgi:2-succinyl-5-enolpyruvyl-6-hydroxy-3-cyclohexene-1-carboxylate synthase
VLVNNRGGGIFEHLPVASAGQPFEDFCATPQDTDFGALAVAHGVPFIAVRDWEHLVSLVSTLPPAGLRLLEVRTDRKADAAGRKRLFAELAATLG